MERQIHNLLKKFKEKEKEEILNCAFEKIYNCQTCTSVDSYNKVSIKKGV